MWRVGGRYLFRFITVVCFIYGSGEGYVVDNVEWKNILVLCPVSFWDVLCHFLRLLLIHVLNFPLFNHY